MKLRKWLPATLILLGVGLGFGLGLSTTALTKEPTPAIPPMQGVKLGDPLPSNLFVELAKRINPAVVNISTTLPYPQGGRDPMFEMFEEFFGAPGMGQPHSGRPPQAQALGTGFVIREDGYILTNNHVVQEGSIKVSFEGKPDQLFDAKIVGRDVRGDLSLIKIDAPKKLPFLQLGSSEKLQVGEWVAAFGNPLGHANTMTVGIISAKGREIGEINRWPFLQTDASINQGNSGGPLVDTNGYVIGVNTAIDARGQGIGFAIPSDYIKNILPTLFQGTSIKRGFLGIGIGSLSPQISQALNLNSSEGAIITEVVPGGPADKAGLKEYDIVKEFNGKKVEDDSTFMRMVQDTAVGEKVKINVLRPVARGQIQQKTINATVGTHPQDEATKETPKLSYEGQKAPFELGFTVSDRPKTESNLRNRLFQGGPVPGPVVTSVDRQSPAQRSGLIPGDVILDINQRRTRTSKDVLTALKDGSNMVRVQRGNRVFVIVLQKA